MNLEDLARIEEAIEYRLADDLRELYLRYPFHPASWAGELAMPNDVSLVLELNGPDGICDSPALSGREVLQIGSDGGESVYFAETVGGRTRILELELETGAVSSQWENLETWVADLESAQREIDEDQARMKRRPWWKVWR